MAETMDDVYLAYMSDDAFTHLRQQANFVPGDGSQCTSVVFVGEAPGANEDRNGRPFCGRSGNILDAALFDAGMRRDLVWTTNTVKYRPPNNRTPTSDEVEASRPYIRRELAVLAAESGQKPVIVPLGAAALSLFSADAISRVRGSLYKLANGWCAWPMFHPAATIYDASKRGVFGADVIRLAQWLQEEGR